jgi:hypothetical protein
MSGLTQGQLSDTAWVLAGEIPVVGRFVAVYRELDDIWRRGPHRAAGIRDEVIERVVTLIETSRADLELRFNQLSDQVQARLGSPLEAQLEKLTDLTKRGIADAAVGQAFYLTLLNEGVIGGQDLPLADFVLHHLSTVDLQLLLMAYDDYQQWQHLEVDRFNGDQGRLPNLTMFEAAYRLARLQDFGFFLSQEGTSAVSVNQRSYEPDIGVIHDFIPGAGIVRGISVSPGEPGAADDIRTSNDPDPIGPNWRNGLFSGEGGMVRRHILYGYQWKVRIENIAWKMRIEKLATVKRGETKWTGPFATAADAQAAATAELERLGWWADWIPFGA